jgi:hypothetical protein
MRRRTAVAVWLAGLAACGGARAVPAVLNDYEVVSRARDSVGIALVRELEARGLPVRRDVRGGGAAAAALLYHEFRDPPPATGRWLHLRLYDTRSGIILLAATLRTDSLPPTARARARAAVDALFAPPSADTEDIP